MVDYLIIGSGLAGISFAETLSRSTKTFIVINDQTQNSSRIAAGIYNPVVLKRFSSTFQAQEQLDYLQEFYKSIEHKLDARLNSKVPVFRRFSSIEEQNDWFTAADKPALTSFLSEKLIQNPFNGITSQFGYGEVMQTGWVDTALLVQEYADYLIRCSLLIEETFNHESLLVQKEGVKYQNIMARQIVFCEGFGLKNNPFFNYLPLDGTKGELIIIEAPGLNANVIINSSVFIVPLGNNFFKVGATYNWDDKDSNPTEFGKKELVDKLNTIITCEYTIVSHLAGVRPTVKDRKPLIGTHHIHKNIHILNGLGTRGVMLAPSMAKLLFETIEFGNILPKEINIRRYDALLPEDHN